MQQFDQFPWVLYNLWNLYNLYLNFIFSVLKIILRQIMRTNYKDKSTMINSQFTTIIQLSLHYTENLLKAHFLKSIVWSTNGLKGFH